jgi:3-dehydroquinate synthase
MALPSRITLIGAFGTGKSTVARLVAERLGWEAVDVDDLIVAEAGREVDALFAEEGEAAWRRREGAALAMLAGRDRIVVAAGGGATVVDTTRRAVVGAGLVVCLTATPETVVARLESKAGRPRPMAGGGDRLARTRRLLDQRAAMYALADFAVATDFLTPEEVAAEVMRLYQTYGERAWSRPGRVAELSRTPSVLPPVIDAPGESIIVRAASGEYPVYVGWGELERLGEHTGRATGARRVFLLSDANVLPRWGEAALSSLRSAGLEADALALPAGEASKDMAGFAAALDWLASRRAERRDAIVNLGGGMVGDLGGFVAGVYMRGLSYVQAPTSLLAMVDASIGGKTAINHAGAKNLAGLFYQPRAVVADVSLLATLPRRALVEGLAEVIKHALILDPALLSLLEERLEGVLALEQELSVEVVRRSMEVKAAIVSEDERETGGRRELLNYGHTLGHALEAAGGYEALLHGEAVAIGMLAAAEIGRRMGMTPAALVARQRALVERAGLPLRPPAGLERDRVLAALALDKKVVGGRQRWVLLEEAGRAAVRDDVPAELARAVLDEVLGS